MSRGSRALLHLANFADQALGDLEIPTAYSFLKGLHRKARRGNMIGPLRTLKHRMRRGEITCTCQECADTDGETGLVQWALDEIQDRYKYPGEQNGLAKAHKVDLVYNAVWIWVSARSVDQGLPGYHENRLVNEVIQEAYAKFEERQIRVNGCPVAQEIVKALTHRSIADPERYQYATEEKKEAARDRLAAKFNNISNSQETDGWKKIIKYLST